MPPAPDTDPSLENNDLGNNNLLGLAVGVVIVVTLYVARDVLVPIALAILLSFMLAPLVRLFRRFWLGRVPAVLLAMAVALGVVLCLGGLIGTQLGELLTDLPRYATTIEQKIVGARGLVVGKITNSLGGLGHRIEQASSEPVLPAANSEAGTQPKADPKPTSVVVRQPDPTSVEIAERVLSPILSPLATTGIVFVMAIFILLQQADLRDRFIRLFGMQDLYRTTRALDDAARRLSRYLLTQLGLNTAFGIMIGVGLWLIGVPNPLLWGVLATLLRFIPYIGSLISGSMPTALAASVDPGWGMAIWTASLFALTETVMGQFVDPLAYGKSTGLSPVSVVIAAIFWAWMWGPIGLILSMPLTVCLVVLGRHVQRLEFLDVLMGDRPALTPVESFYQRILANDPDEALDQAEMLLKDCSLSAYYDQVAINGLQLVAADAERGVLSAAQIVRIEQAMARLVEELDEYDDLVPSSAKPRKSETSGLDASDVAPAPTALAVEDRPSAALPAAQPGSILCISGRGPLDCAVSDMLVQLLTKNGLAARVAPYEAVARGAVETLDYSGVALVCVSSLEIAGKPSHLRYFVRRIRQRVSDRPILVGLYPWFGETSEDDRLRSAVGADYFVSSLHEAITVCLRTVQPIAEKRVLVGLQAATEPAGVVAPAEASANAAAL